MSSRDPYARVVAMIKSGSHEQHDRCPGLRHEQALTDASSDPERAPAFPLSTVQPVPRVRVPDRPALGDRVRSTWCRRTFVCVSGIALVAIGTVSPASAKPKVDQ